MRRSILLASLAGLAVADGSSQIDPTFECLANNTLVANIIDDQATNVLKLNYGNCNLTTGGITVETETLGADTLFIIMLNPADCFTQDNWHNDQHEFVVELGFIDDGTSLFLGKVEFDAWCDYKTEYDIVFSYGTLESDRANFTGSGGTVEVSFMIKAYSGGWNESNQLTDPPRIGGRPIDLGIFIDSNGFDHCAYSFAIESCTFSSMIGSDQFNYTIFTSDGNCSNDQIELSVGYQADYNMWTVEHILFLLGNSADQSAKLYCHAHVCRANDVSSKCYEISNNCLGSGDALSSSCTVEVPEEPPTSFDDVQEGATVDPCDPHPCVHSSVCTASGDSAQCGTFADGVFNCDEGWEGQWCDQAVTYCPGICGNHTSQCLDLKGSFECTCSDGYTGDTCETEPEEISHMTMLTTFNTTLNKTQIDDADFESAVRAGLAQGGGKRRKRDIGILSNTDYIYWLLDNGHIFMSDVHTRSTSCDVLSCDVQMELRVSLRYYVIEVLFPAFQSKTGGRKRRQAEGLEVLGAVLMEDVQQISENTCVSKGGSFTKGENTLESIDTSAGVDACKTMPCGHGVCTDNSDMDATPRTCSCNKGYEASAAGNGACDHHINYCASNPCASDEDCQNGIGAAVCHAAPMGESHIAAVVESGDHACIAGLPQESEWRVMPSNPNVAYLPVTERKTWIEAKAACEALGEGVTLATIMNAEEDAFVRSLNRMGWFGLECWTDGHDYCQWVTGERATYLNFEGPQQPDKSCTKMNRLGGWTENSTTTGNCVYMYGTGWDDYCCSNEDPIRTSKAYTCMIRGCPAAEAPSHDTCLKLDASPEWKRVGDALFWLNSQPHTNDDADAACRAIGHGTTLAAPRNLVENEMMTTMTVGRTWLGFQCWTDENPNECLRPDGENATFYHWNNPNYAIGGRWEAMPDHSGKCIITNFFGLKMWDDYLCSGNFPSICEQRGCPRELPPGSPADVGDDEPCDCEAGDLTFSDAGPISNGFDNVVGSVDMSSDGYIVTFDLEFASFGEVRAYRGIIEVGNIHVHRIPGLWLKGGTEAAFDLRHNQYDEWGTQTGWPQAFVANAGLQLNTTYQIRISAVPNADCDTGFSVSLCVDGKRYMHRCLKPNTAMKNMDAQDITIGGRYDNSVNQEAEFTVSNLEIRTPSSRLPSCDGIPVTTAAPVTVPPCSTTVDINANGFMTRAFYENPIYPTFKLQYPTFSEYFVTYWKNSLVNPVTVYWIVDNVGMHSANYRESFMFIIQPGQTRWIRTYIGHQFVVRDSGDIVAVFIVDEKQHAAAKAAHSAVATLDITQAEVDWFNSADPCESELSYQCVWGEEGSGASIEECGCSEMENVEYPDDGFFNAATFYQVGVVGWGLANEATVRDFVNNYQETITVKQITLEHVGTEAGQIHEVSLGSISAGGTLAVKAGLSDTFWIYNLRGEVVMAFMVVATTGDVVDLNLKRAEYFLNGQPCYKIAGLPAIASPRPTCYAGCQDISENYAYVSERTLVDTMCLPKNATYDIEFDVNMSSLGSTGLGSDYRSLMKVGDYGNGQACYPCVFVSPYSNALVVKYGAIPVTQSFCSPTSNQFTFSADQQYSIGIKVGNDATMASGRFISTFVDGVMLNRCEISEIAGDLIDVEVNVGADVYNVGSEAYKGGNGAIGAITGFQLNSCGDFSVAEVGIATTSEPYTIPCLRTTQSYKLDFNVKIDDHGSQGLGSDYRTIMKVGGFPNYHTCYPCIHMSPYGNGITVSYGNRPSSVCRPPASVFAFATNQTYNVQVNIGDDYTFPSGRYVSIHIDGTLIGRCELEHPLAADLTDVDVTFGPDIWNHNSDVYKAGNGAKGTITDFEFEGCSGEKQCKDKCIGASQDTAPVVSRSLVTTIPCIPKIAPYEFKFDVRLSDLGSFDVYRSLMKVGKYTSGQECYPCVFIHPNQNNLAVKYGSTPALQSYCFPGASDFAFDVDTTHSIAVRIGNDVSYQSSRYMSVYADGVHLMTCEIEFLSEDLKNVEVNLGADVYNNMQGAYTSGDGAKGEISNFEMSSCSEVKVASANITENSMVYTMPCLRKNAEYQINFKFQLNDIGLGGSGADYKSLMKVGSYNNGQSCLPCAHIHPHGNALAVKYGRMPSEQVFCFPSAAEFAFVNGTEYDIGIKIGNDPSLASGRYMSLHVDGDLLKTCEIGALPEDMMDVDVNLGADSFNTWSTAYRGGNGAKGSMTDFELGCGTE